MAEMKLLPTHKGLLQEKTPIFGMVIGLVVNDATVMVGDPKRVIKDRNIVVGVTGNFRLVNKLLKMLRRDIFGIRSYTIRIDNVEEYAGVVLSHIRALKIRRNTHLHVLVGGYDRKNPFVPKLFYVNKGGITGVVAKSIGNGAVYADLVVKDQRVFNKNMTIKKAFALAKRGFSKAQLVHYTGTRFVIGTHVLLPKWIRQFHRFWRFKRVLLNKF
ncbi:uncharacterized protein LOC113361087 [Papaver somniferum]|uniref:uncharacterized protein LOC113361087 n=1 Tax=Papaver somniferum TaxID=3469 RepID=UPI000E6F8F17|nr:uncharacterized protein LOC113361087 [Papaver somniferum]